MEKVSGIVVDWDDLESVRRYNRRIKRIRRLNFALSFPPTELAKKVMINELKRSGNYRNAKP